MEEKLIRNLQAHRLYWMPFPFLEQSKKSVGSPGTRKSDTRLNKGQAIIGGKHGK